MDARGNGSRKRKIEDEVDVVRRRFIYFVRHGESANNAAKHNDCRTGEADTSVCPSTSSKTRVADPSVTEKGARQCWGLVESKTLDHINVGQVWSSAMVRCVETTKILCANMPDVPIKIIGELHEEGGLFDGPRALQGKGLPQVYGLTQSEILRLFPSASNVSFESAGCSNSSSSSSTTASSKKRKSPKRAKSTHSTTTGWWHGGFEDIDHLKQRLDTVREKIFDEVRHPTADANSSVVIVTHGLFMDRILKYLLSIPFDSSVYFLTGNTAVSCLEVECTVGRTGDDGTKVALVYHNRGPHLQDDLRSTHSCGGFKLTQ